MTVLEKTLDELDSDERDHLGKVIEACKEMGWGVKIKDTYLCLMNHSPLGEDISFDVSLEYPCSDIFMEYTDFYVDDHVKMLMPYLGTIGVPNDIQALIDDAKEIEKMLEELSDAVEKVY